MNYIALENRNLEIAQVFIFVRVVACYWKDLCVLDFRREYFLKGGGSDHNFTRFPLIIILGIPVIVNTTKIVTGRIVVVVWEPLFEGACPIDRYTVYYREVMSPRIKSEWHSITMYRNTTSYILQLNCNKEYDVAVTSRNGYGESNLSESKIWNFKTVRGNNTVM